MSVEVEVSVSPSPGTVPGDQQQLWLEVLRGNQWTQVGKKKNLGKKKTKPGNPNPTMLQNAPATQFSQFSGGFVCLYVYIYYVYRSYRSITYNK